MLGPARRLTRHTLDRICPSSVPQVNGSVTSIVSSVSLSRTPPLSHPRSNPNLAVVVATSATAAAANPMAARCSRDPTTTTQGARGYELELHRWWHQKGACPPTGLPQLPCSSDPNPEQATKLVERVVREVPQQQKGEDLRHFLIFFDLVLVELI